MGLFSNLYKKNFLDNLGEKSTDSVIKAINELGIGNEEMLNEKSMNKLRNNLRTNHRLMFVQEEEEDLSEIHDILEELGSHGVIYPGTIAYRVGFLYWRDSAKFFASKVDRDRDGMEMTFNDLLGPSKEIIDGYNDCRKYMDIFKKTEELDKDTIGYSIMGIRRHTTYTAKLNNVGSKKLKEIVNKEFSNLGYLNFKIPS